MSANSSRKIFASNERGHSVYEIPQSFGFCRPDTFWFVAIDRCSVRQRKLDGSWHLFRLVLRGVQHDRVFNCRHPSGGTSQRNISDGFIPSQLWACPRRSICFWIYWTRKYFCSDRYFFIVSSDCIYGTSFGSGQVYTPCNTSVALYTRPIVGHAVLDVSLPHLGCDTYLDFYIRAIDCKEECRTIKDQTRLKRSRPRAGFVLLAARLAQHRLEHLDHELLLRLR